ncbi:MULTISPECIES: hypothetical protein [Comamonadaceae]|uniref:hypothetical protein n=1 Tax=Comamonadaceae TaxID=80864 RepID=UPI000BC53B43|nr:MULTISPECIES: hypothetical protein [Comamonadaceae]OZA57507.1 MAG: hypothetical protein B7X79_06410 [Acidovorax sp. 17-64-282]HQT19457.1 hypothetical protein [Acidovorax defluvii]OYY25910.1 MAG: hypothetical protein B7Y64_17885 [Acidovorax sp. 35-64-16]OYY85136.1 MAG: hypothetical protein B7Y46_10445 [Acidovorax sp. 28-64-14]OZA67275.1 MAG: hypothetical protein B7X70_17945 [Acidovorax sp. 39-64-12]
MKPEDMLRQALGIDAPWSIVRMQNDLGAHQIDLWVAQEAPRSGWLFGGAKALPPSGEEQAWRHLNIGRARCIVHAVPAGTTGQGDQSWLGEADQPFSRAFARQIAGMFMEGVSFQAICALLDIPLAELWRFKHNLDNGKLNLSAPLPVAGREDSPAIAIPEAADPVWEKLLDGRIHLEIRALSLKFLLTRQREQFAAISDGEVRILKVHEMQRYFVRHQKTLGHELAQLNRL